jgi:hypothetical protein
MKTRTNNNRYSEFHTLCGQYGLNYKEKVLEFTKGKINSLRALTDDQYEEMLRRLKTLTGKKDFEVKPGDDKRKTIISIARDMQWDINGKIDLMKRINNFTLTRTKFKKRLNALSIAELDHVIYIMRTEVKPDFLKGIIK